MRGSLSEAQAAFRDEVRAFLEAELDPQVSEKVRRGAPVSRSEAALWAKKLDVRGWAAPSWPREYGGPGWSLIERHIFDEECRAAHAPVLSGMNYNMVGPAIIRYGNDAQKREHLEPTRTSERFWCQGYSEPQAGSDLATLRMQARRDGDDYIVSGQKTWTTGAEDADWIFCLVRTDADAKPQRGISFLLIDLKSPGVRRKPLYAFNGKMLWNEVFFDEVRVPVANRLGEENQGWTVAKSLLGDERLFVSRVAENKRCLGLVRQALEDVPRAHELVDKAHALDVRLRALEATSLRLLTEADAGGQVGAEPSMLKLLGSQLVQAMDVLLLEAAAHWSLPSDGEGYPGPRSTEYVASGAYHHRGYTIAGGTSEVQHNIIAQQVLGL